MVRRAIVLFLPPVLVAGCGLFGGEGRESSSESAVGYAKIVIEWPKQARWMPPTAQLVKIWVFRVPGGEGEVVIRGGPPEEEPVAYKEVQRPEGAGTVEVVFTLPVGTMLFRVTAFGNSPEPLAGGSQTAEIKAGETTEVEIVLAGIPKTLEVEPSSATLEPGQTLQLSALPKDADGNEIPEAIVVWYSKDPSVATVSPTGLVTARDIGTTQVIAECAGVEARADITVQYDLRQYLPLETGRWWEFEERETTTAVASFSRAETPEERFRIEVGEETTFEGRTALPLSHDGETTYVAVEEEQFLWLGDEVEEGKRVFDPPTPIPRFIRSYEPLKQAFTLLFTPTEGEAESFDGNYSFEFRGPERVDVPAGTFDALHLLMEWRWDDDWERHNWWVAKDVGWVKIRRETPRGMVELNLTGHGTASD